MDVHLVSHDSQKPYFFIWAEAGARGSEEISSAIIAFLDAAGVSATSTCKIIFWSDSCAGQNKNFYTVCLWQYLIAIKCAGRIDHKFPETGHSYLDSDRDFAHIEKCVRSRQTIFSVNEWQIIMTKSQSNKEFAHCDKDGWQVYSIKQPPDLLRLHNSHKNTDGQRVQKESRFLMAHQHKTGHSVPFELKIKANGIIRWQRVQFRDKVRWMRVCGKLSHLSLPRATWWKLAVEKHLSYWCWHRWSRWGWN